LSRSSDISFFRSPFFSLAVTLQCLWVLSVEHKDSQCTCNVTLGRVRVTVVAVVKRYVLQIMRTCPDSCLSFPAYKEHAPYYVFNCDLSGSNSSLQIISKTARLLGKQVTEYKIFVRFFVQLLSEIFLIIRRIQQDTINAHRSSCKVTVIRIGF